MVESKPKICPFMSSKPNICSPTAIVECYKDRCELWVPEQTTIKMCSLVLEREEECPLKVTVEMPADISMLCIGCEHFTEEEIAPIPAHCGMIKSPLG